MELGRPPRNGTVIRYAYLWRDEARRGRDEGRKDRPGTVILARQEPRSGLCYVFVLPISHSPPTSPEIALEISADESRTMGLDGEPAWLICNELNQFLWPGFDLRPVPGSDPPTHVYGMMPPGLYERARARFLALRKSGRASTVVRD